MIKNLLLFLLLILISCSKDNENEKTFYMSAMIDNVMWRVTGYDTVRFSTEYDYTNNIYRIDIHANNLFVNPPVDYGKMISIRFDFTPKPGRYYFNNVGSLNIDSGIIATYTYWNVNHHDYKWSINGHIDIKSIFLDSITGTFSFAAKGDTLNNDTVFIENGKFSAFYGGGDHPWPGPNK